MDNITDSVTGELKCSAYQCVKSPTENLILSVSHVFNFMWEKLPNWINNSTPLHFGIVFACFKQDNWIWLKLNFKLYLGNQRNEGIHEKGRLCEGTI